jgi:uncharacterized protein with von Willebrand factor type A (vWA) domain
MRAETLIARRIAAFSATLREAGFATGMSESADAARIVASPLARSAATLRPALRALFAGRRADWERFDALFDAAFLGRRARRVVQTSGAPQATPGPRSLRALAAERAERRRDGSAEAAETTETGEALDDGEAMRGGMSTTTSGAESDMRRLGDPDALAAAEAVALRLITRLRARDGRQRRRVSHGGRLDLRQTIRASLGHGGTPFDLVWKRPRPEPLRIALLLDVSGSMTPHTPLFLRFALGVMRRAEKAEVFLIHTRLASVGEAMRDRDRPRALDRLTLLAKGIGGGTRLGESIALFNRRHAPRALAGRAVCFIVSDGFETSDPALLGREMAALRRRCRRIVWLNPVMARADDEPIAQGMRAALPHLRLLAPAGSLEGLAALEESLSRL